MDIYKEAIRNNYTFNTNVGVMTVAKLFTASDNTLTDLEESLKEQVKDAKKSKNRFQKVVVKDKTLKIKLAIVTDVIDTIIEEREADAARIANKKEEQELLKRLKDIQDEKKSKMSEEEVLKRLDELRG